MAEQMHLRTRLDVGAAGRSVVAYWSTQPDGRAVVFVHGFGGSATETWMQFPTLVPREPGCAGCDALYFEYDSVYAQSGVNGAVLRRFLSRLVENPVRLVNDSLPPSATPRMEHEVTDVLIVAHSLGAVVARRALLDAHRAGETWVRKCRLLLFAPAHLGATNITALAAEGLGLIPIVGPALALLSRWKVRVLEELKPGSQTLTSLEAHTLEALTSGPRPYLIAQRVLFGTLEATVHAGSFCADPPMVAIEGKGHRDVCKPAPGYMEPMEHLRELL